MTCASYWPTGKALRDQQGLAGRAVVNVLGDLRGDLARQVGPDPGDQCRGDHRARLQDIRTGRRFDAVGTDGATVDGAIEKGELVILRGCVGHGCGWRWRSGGGSALRGGREHLPVVRFNEELALDCGLPLLRERIGRDRRCRRPSVDDRLAEIARERRAELRHLPRQPGVVARQAREALGGRRAAEVVEFRAGRPAMRFECEEEGGGYTGGRNDPEPEQHFAGQPRHRRAARPQAHLCLDMPAPSSWVGHDCGLPSVRTTRTTCWCSPPSRNSAAANRRSTIMWLPWTR